MSTLRLDFVSLRVINPSPRFSSSVSLRPSALRPRLEETSSFRMNPHFFQKYSSMEKSRAKTRTKLMICPCSNWRRRRKAIKARAERKPRRLLARRREIVRKKAIKRKK